MKYELKIALPMYKIIYSMLFMVIIILVRPIMSYNEIVSVLESSVALLAGVFMADIYYMEHSLLKKACIQQGAAPANSMNYTM